MKKFKMLLYAAPGVGKSTFAAGLEKPFFITTDGNYEWLVDMGAKKDANVTVSSWSDMKKVFDSNFDGYETVVVDLLEDAFKWCEYEFCKKQRIDHVSDLGFAKGYDITRNEFFIELSKLINKDKNIVFISHEVSVGFKDRRGVDHTSFRPSNRIPDKVLDLIEGRMRYVLRAYLAAEKLPDGHVIKKRMLSLVPKENEYGILRGIDENNIPHDIPLDPKVFLDVISKNEIKVSNTNEQSSGQLPKDESTQVFEKEVKSEVKTETKVVEEKVEQTEQKEVDLSKLSPLERLKAKAKMKQQNQTQTQQNVDDFTKGFDDVKMEEVKSEVKTETKVVEEKVEQTNEAPKTTSLNIDALKAKLAAMKAGKK